MIKAIMMIINIKLEFSVMLGEVMVWYKRGGDSHTYIKLIPAAV